MESIDDGDGEVIVAAGRRQDGGGVSILTVIAYPPGFPSSRAINHESTSDCHRSGTCATRICRTQGRGRPPIKTPSIRPANTLQQNESLKTRTIGRCSYIKRTAAHHIFLRGVPAARHRFVDPDHFPRQGALGGSAGRARWIWF